MLPEQRRDTFLCRYALASVAVLLALGIPFRVPVFEGVSYVLAFGAVVMSALWGGLGPAVFAATVCSLAINFAFAPPYYQFSTNPNVDDVLHATVFFITSIMVAAFVADLRRTRRNLIRSEERYRCLADTSAEALIVVDEHATIVYANTEAEKMFDCSAQTAVGKQLTHLLPKATYESALSQLRFQPDSRRSCSPVPLAFDGAHLTGRAELTVGAMSRHGMDFFALRMRCSSPAASPAAS